jgi:hypothetical protein
MEPGTAIDCQKWFSLSLAEVVNPARNQIFPVPDSPVIKMVELQSAALRIAFFGLRIKRDSPDIEGPVAKSADLPFG